MNDKQIRNILIEYLKSVNSKIRIYQEKSVGGSICDLMAVTDCLTGYEIKSDFDNYKRLSSQISAYNRFFDRNYIVVGEKHLISSEEKVPGSWGIICIKSDNIEIYREAKQNRKVNRRSQLSVLWKLELKNILVKNNMPLFAQKDKGYISDRIVGSVDRDILGKQIADELFERDYSVYSADDHTIKQSNNAAIDIPKNEIIDRLSEEDLAEFTLDQWIALYHEAQKIREKKAFIYDNSPVKRVDHDIKYTDINVSLGAPWISEHIINDFIVHLCGDSLPLYFEPKAAKERITGNWHISKKTSDYARMNTKLSNVFGILRYNALQILEATLNLREIKIHDGNMFNENDTIAALEKQKVIIEEFNGWIWKSEDRIWEIEEAYNNMFASFEKTYYDGSKLEFPKMNPYSELYDYQKDAVQKIISTKNTLLAFDVGAGKTYIMIAAAMKLREMGLSRKNLFVVPNNIVGQWEKMFTELYPDAKVLTIEPKSFKPSMRQKVLRQMRDADYDGIIIAYSCFEKIPLSVQFVTEELSRKTEKLNAAINKMWNESKYWGWGTTAVEREREYIKKSAYELLESKNYEYQGITFDELEVNTLFLDEAHNYKNIPLRTALKNLNGINTKGSLKCLDMQKKIKCVQDSNGGRGVVFATGTPLCNSISDAYALQMYLQPEEMEQRELHIFDNWVKTFALPEQSCEIDVDTSKYRMIRRFARFFNLPELSRMFSQIAVFHAVKQKDLPEFQGYTDVVIKKNEMLTGYMKELSERADDIRARRVDKKSDNMLKVSTDGRKAALDLSLVGCVQRYDENSKVFRCAEKVYAIFRADPECSQLVFCDYSTPKAGDFNVYDKIKELLIKMGIDEKKIAFIHSYGTESSKLRLFEDVNNAKINVLIGSTFKLGIGANVQTKLKAVHHLDAPWRPADMVQREGRILRQGNENEEINIYRYIAEGSFDAYSWQILEKKQSFISQFLSGSAYQRSVSDLEENVLTYAEVKALALAQPLMKVKAEKENELKTLELLSTKKDEENEKLEHEYKELSKKIEMLELRAGHSKITLNELKFKPVKKEEIELLKSILTSDRIFGKKKTKSFNVSVFSCSFPKEQDSKKPYVILNHGFEDYVVYMGDKPTGNATRICNFIKKFGRIPDECNREIREGNERLINISSVLQSEHSYDQQIRQLKEELTIINERLNIA